MTLKRLKEYRFLEGAIRSLEEQLRDLYDRAGGSMSPDLSGMPHGSGPAPFSAPERGLMQYGEEIDRTKRRIAQCRRKKRQVEKFLDGIGDEVTRQAFTLRFVRGYSWAGVAARMYLTEDAVKKMCYRYLEKISGQ